jgi:hypothetical protein
VSAWPPGTSREFELRIVIVHDRLDGWWNQVPSQDSMRRALVETNLKVLAKDEVQSTTLDLLPLLHAERAVRGVKGRDNADAVIDGATVKVRYYGL